MRTRWLVGILLSLSAFEPEVHAQQSGTPPNSTLAASSGDQKKVVAKGTVPDEATRALVLQRLRATYGADLVVDEIEVGSVVAPPNWKDYVGSLLELDLQSISGGELEIQGNSVRFSGSVANEAARQELLSGAVDKLNPTYTVKNALEILPVESRQTELDSALAGRTIEFRTGSAVLTASGQRILDEMAEALDRIGQLRVTIEGHTDNVGSAPQNVALSIERATAVKAYLVERGIDPARLSVMGYGPDRPVASNDTPEGRARNRRIEFRIVQ